MPENAATLKAANEAREVSGSGATDCSLAVHVPEIPAEAIGFAEAMAALAKEHGIRECEMSIRVDTGYRTRFWNDHELREKTQERKKDGDALGDVHQVRITCNSVDSMIIRLDRIHIIHLMWDHASSAPENAHCLSERGYLALY